MAIGLAVALVASAGTVVLTSGSAAAGPDPATVTFYGGPDPRLWFSAGEGTLNDVVVRDKSDGFEIEDRAAPINLIAESTCFLANTHTVRCRHLPNMQIVAELKDGGDFFGGVLSSVPAKVKGDVGKDKLWGGGGADYLDGGWDDDEVRGFSGSDTLVGDSGDDEIHGDGGDDSAAGGAGDDLVHGDDGNDRVFGDWDDDTLTGGDGDDHLVGSYDDDRLLGQAGNDTLTDQFGVNTVSGGTGNDTFYLMGSTGAAYQGSTDYDGGPGFDTIDYSKAAHPYRVVLDDQANDQRIPLDPNDRPDNVRANIENVIGSGFNDRLIGNDAMNDIDGGDGKDYIDGKGGDDYLDAQRGYSEKVIGGDGYDTCVGWDLEEPEGCEYL